MNYMLRISFHTCKLQPLYGYHLRDHEIYYSAKPDINFKKQDKSHKTFNLFQTKYSNIQYVHQ
jgi:hypothetical protein